MSDKSLFDQQKQNVEGGQINIAGNQILQQPMPPRLQLQNPPRVSHFIGREDELASLLDDLQPGRVVTLCGPGGMGKTALAIEALWKLAPGKDPPELFPNGIIFHTFYHKPESALALEAIARAYGEEPRPSPAEAARRALSGRQALIVLDGAEAAEDLDAVLGVTGSCGVLITSRRHQDAPAEWQNLPPLPLDNAVQLLQAWAGDYASDEASAHRICELLGGLPLAVYLVGRYLAQRSQHAAEYLAWLETTPLDALDLGERQHQSVPLLIERSLEQVGEKAREALGLAGVLAREPFEPQLVAIGLGIDQQQADHSLGELVDYGIMSRPDARYQVVHALLHTYARERLDPTKEALARLADHYDRFARKQSELGPKGYAELDLNRAYILVVQSACLAKGEGEAVRRLTWAIDGYLDLQGHWTERVAVSEAGLKAAHADGSRYDEGAFLNKIGLTKAALGELRRAIEFHEQALEIYREIGNRRGEGAVLGSLGNAYAALGEPRRAIEFYEKRIDIAREIGDRRGEGNALYNMSLSLEKLGEHARAIEFASSALDIYEQIESPVAEQVRQQLEEWRE